MGLIGGCVLGGFACYQYVEVGHVWRLVAFLRLCHGRWHEGRRSVDPGKRLDGQVRLNCVWFVIWFNVVFMLVCVVIGYVCGMMGVQPGQNLGVAKTERRHALLQRCGGLLLFAFFQILFLVCKSITSKTSPLPS